MSLVLWLLRQGRLRVWCPQCGEPSSEGPTTVCRTCHQRVDVIGGIISRHTVAVPSVETDAAS